MIKQTQVFFSREDEVDLSRALLAVRPRLVFVDGVRWPTSAPVCAPDIASCKSWRTALWDQGIVHALPFYTRSDGQFEGPMTACVIEFSRSRIQGNLILSGRIAISIGGSDTRLVSDMKSFFADVWKVLKKMSSHPLAAVNPETGEVLRTPVPEYRAGDRAVAWASSDPSHFFRDRSTQIFFRPS